MRVIKNCCPGGWFCVSTEALLWLVDHEYDPACRYLREEDWQFRESHQIDAGRSDVQLIACIDELGERANTLFSKLKIIEVPDGMQWDIMDYGGIEFVVEKHRVFG